MKEPKTKRCRKCQRRKPVGKFYRHPTNKGGLQAYRNQCQALVRASGQRRSYWHLSEKARITTRKARQAWKKRNRARCRQYWLAEAAIRSAFKKGIIKKSGCEVCGESNVHAHHADYNKPLAIQWLCPEHHRQWHKVNKPIYRREA